METTGRSTVVAVFETRAQAEAAIDDLWHSGFAHDQIGIAGPGESVNEAHTVTGKVEKDAANGAVTGAVTGGVLGALAGTLATALIPGVGAVIAGGLLMGMLGGAAAGAAAGSYLGPFIALGFTEEEARQYQREFEAGRTVVVVKAGERCAEAITILHSHGGYNYNPEACTSAS
jgi:hypothetical protein